MTKSFAGNFNSEFAKNECVFWSFFLDKKLEHLRIVVTQSWAAPSKHSWFLVGFSFFGGSMIS